MAKPGAEQRDWKQSIRPALIISLAMGVVAGVVGTVASSGGTKNGLNVQFGGVAFLIAFVVGLVVISLLMMVAKENSGEMGRGAGVNRSSELSDDELRELEAKEAGRAARVTVVSDAASEREAAGPDASGPAASDSAASENAASENVLPDDAAPASADAPRGAAAATDPEAPGAEPRA